MNAATSISDPAELRLMPFGRKDARRIKDGLFEPMWRGDRVLVLILGGAVTVRDEDGDEVEGHEALRSAILEATLSDELVIDGYIAPALPPDATGLEVPPGMDEVASSSEISRRLLLGGVLRNERREALVSERLRPADAPSIGPMAFIATDLLWMDGLALLDVPLLERKRLLELALLETQLVRRSVAVRPPVSNWFAQWRAFGFGEMTVKAANSRYTPGRPNEDWAIDVIPKR